VFFATAVPPAGIDLLTRVIPVANVLFASEMSGAVRGVDRDRFILRRHQSLHRASALTGEKP